MTADAVRFIPGPRVPLRYGSAATVIDVPGRRWRMVERTDEWKAIDDYTHPDNVIGKWVRVKRLGAQGLAVAPDELDEVLVVKSFGNHISVFDLDAVEVIDGPTALNGFERVIAGASGVAKDIPAMAGVVEEARKLRLDMKRRVLGLGGDYRAGVMRVFDWTENDLDEAR